MLDNIRRYSTFFLTLFTMQLYAQDISVKVVYDKSYKDIKTDLDLSYNDNSLKKVIKKFDTEIFSKITKGKSSSTEHSFSDDNKIIDVQLLSNRACSPCDFMDQQLKKLNEANKEYPLDDIKILIVGDIEELSPIIGECDFMDKAKYISKGTDFFKQKLKQIKKRSRGENVGVIFFYPTDEAPSVQLKVNNKKNILFLNNRDTDLRVIVSSTFKNSSRIGLLSFGDKERKFQFDEKGKYSTRLETNVVENGNKICVSVEGCDKDFGDCIEIQKQECDPVPKSQKAIIDASNFEAFQLESIFPGVDYDLIGIEGLYHFAVEKILCVESYKVEIRYAEDNSIVGTYPLERVGKTAMKAYVSNNTIAEKYVYLRLMYKNMDKEIFDFGYGSKALKGFKLRIIPVPYGGVPQSDVDVNSKAVVAFNKC